jgi:ATP-dependent helicase HrpB
MLVEQICHGAVVRIKERPVWPIHKGVVVGITTGTAEQVAPERIGMPNGKKFKVIYAAKAAPTVAVRIQDLYGVDGELRRLRVAACLW